ncbi:hypothetical protein HIR70_00025 [Pasteurella multocida]|nr:hypothetical protein [Pasteurella multocida]NMR61169.1 hypothetical protein [Pasteurella multocida]
MLEEGTRKLKGRVEKKLNREGNIGRREERKFPKGREKKRKSKENE